MVYEQITEMVINGKNRPGVNLYWGWELDFLTNIQNLHNPVLDVIMKIFTTLGEAGLLWIAISIVLAIIPKTRKCGFTMMLSMILTLAIGNGILKNVLARMRPCWVYDLSQIGKEMLIKLPKDYSFPSGHTMNGVTASMVILFYSVKNKKTILAGIGAVLMAAIIAFSRMYLFVHWPTDIMVGALVGLVDAIISFFVMKKVYPIITAKIAAKKNK